jgi:hypothetical protein
LVAFIALVLWHDRVKQARQRAQRAVAFYERGLARLDDQWIGKGEPGSRFADENHPYSADLDLFGVGSLFERLCAARTPMGQSTLAAWLKHAASAEEVTARQQAVAELHPKLDLREDLAVLSGKSQARLDPDGLTKWATAPPLLQKAWRYAALNLAVTLTIGTLIAWFVWDIGFTPFVAALLIEIGVAVWLSGGTGEVLEAVEKAARDLQLMTEILARLEREPVKAERLLRLRALVETAGLPPSRRIAHLRRLIDWLNADQNQLFTPFALLLLWRIRFAFALDAWRAKYGSAVAGWLQMVGEYEALGALAGYAFENPDDQYPAIAVEGPIFAGEQVGHPLIPIARCVRNDVQLGGDLRVLVVSGSNMSGKSTLLRTVGINTVLALTGAPVRAKRVRVSPMAIGATLRIQDSLQAGKSRFFAEITRLRQLVDLARGPLPLLFLLDEILHGTNSHDRRLGAEAIVRGFVELGAVGLVTTHDLALAEIVERLGSRAANVHFDDELVNGAVTFDYRMRPGVTQHSNALALMRAVGLDV